ncbi:4Fe-4S dicluster domain-containing protein [Chloroflexota bacterium]
MKLGRREFLKASGIIAGISILQPIKLFTPAKAAASTESLSGIAMLIDISKCIGCWWCYAACKNYNNLPETVRPEMDDPPELEAETWSTLFTLQGDDGEWSSRKHSCMHCIDASCELVCPTGAISHRGAAVVIDQEWCIGCGYCVQACPFDVPHKDEHLGTARKCTFCIDRTGNGEEPACAEACPTGAIQFGERTDLITAARAQVEELKGNGYPDANLYGENESGGLHILYVLTDRPSVYGLPEEPQVATSGAVFKWLSGIIAAGIIAVVPFWYLFKRKNRAKDSGSPT